MLDQRSAVDKWWQKKKLKASQQSTAIKEKAMYASLLLRSMRFKNRDKLFIPIDLNIL